METLINCQIIWENIRMSYDKELNSEIPKWLLCEITKKIICMVKNAVAEAAAAHSLNNVLSQTALIQNLAMMGKFSLLPKQYQLRTRETSEKETKTRKHS